LPSLEHSYWMWWFQRPRWGWSRRLSRGLDACGRSTKCKRLMPWVRLPSSARVWNFGQMIETRSVFYSLCHDDTLPQIWERTFDIKISRCGCIRNSIRPTQMRYGFRVLTSFHPTTRRVRKCDLSS
jgi:hypothetical protein